MDIDVTLVDPYFPARGLCEVDGCNLKQRHYGKGRFGKFCEKHHDDPIQKKIRRDTRQAKKDLFEKNRYAKSKLRAEKRRIALLLPVRECKECKKTLTTQHFQDNKKHLRYTCRKCIAKNQRTKDRERNYGINDSVYDELIREQNGCCSICGINISDLLKNEKSNSKTLHIDHCHETKKIRGLLCYKCNLALGLFKDDIDIISSAISYLRNTQIKKCS